MIIWGRISSIICVVFWTSSWEGMLRGVTTGTGVFASRWMIVKKNRAIDTLFVEWVDGNPYSRW